MLLSIANPPAFSNGWVCKFKQRRGLRAFNLHGESASTDTAAIEASLPEFQAKIKQ